MIIDNLYSPETSKIDNDLNDKNNFYIGKVSYVSGNVCGVQVENLSVLRARKVFSENLHPNSVNVMAVINSSNGIFIGNIFESKIKSTDSVHRNLNDDEQEQIYPEIDIEIKGLLKDNHFELVGTNTVGITDKVYLSNDYIDAKYYNSLSNSDGNLPKNKDDEMSEFATIDGSSQKFSIDINSLFNRHLLVVGSTNSGKSTSSLSILSEMIKKNKKILVIDPTGEYKDSFDEKEFKKINLQDGCYIKTKDVSLMDWCTLFNANSNSQPAVLMKAMSVLNNNSGNSIDLVKEPVNSEITKTVNQFNFKIRNLPDQIYYCSVKPNRNGYERDLFALGSNTYLIDKVRKVISDETITNLFHYGSEDDAGINLMSVIDDFCSAQNYFDDETGLKSLYINASDIAMESEFGRFIIDLISQRLLKNKSETKNHPFVMFIDEAHRYTKINEDKYSPLISIGREGRKNGIFLFLSTQRPGDIPASLVSQFGTFIVHRLWHEDDMDIVRSIVNKSSLRQVRNLKQGEAILSGVNVLDDVYLQFNKSNLKHENNTPNLK